MTTCLTRAWSSLLVLTALAAAPAHAQRTAESFLLQDPAPEEEVRDNVVRVGVEMDPSLALRAGYLRAVDVEIDAFRRRLGVHFDLTTIIDLSSWDFEGGVSMLLAEGAGFNVLATVDLELKVVQNEVHSGLTYGYGVALRPGWYDPVWHVAAELSMQGTFAATVFHREAYRELFPNVEDGTYVTDHLSFFAGGSIGFSIERMVLIGLRFAWRFPRTFETYAPYFQPYTINLEIGLRF